VKSLHEPERSVNTVALLNIEPLASRVVVAERKEVSMILGSSPYRKKSLEVQSLAPLPYIKSTIQVLPRMPDQQKADFQ
jgi:hypothetical protein